MAKESVFNLAQYTYSATAKKRKISNIAGRKQVRNLQVLHQNIVVPLVKKYKITKIINDYEKFSKGTLRINSGFRTPALCVAIKSRKTSQHARGEAVDIEIKGVSNKELFSYIKENLPYDQLILENYEGKAPDDGWVHISYIEPRRESFHMSRRGKLSCYELKKKEARRIKHKINLTPFQKFICRLFGIKI